MTTIAVAVVLAESSWEFGAAAVFLGSVWTGYLYRFWRNERMLLVLVSLLLSTLGFGVAAENLLSLEQIFGFRISNKLELSPRLIEWATARSAYRTNTWQQFGNDPMFYRRQPGSLYRERYDYRNVGMEYQAVVDSVGYRNDDRDLYTREPAIEMFIAGDSVMEGVGTPGVIEEIKSTLPFRVYSLSIGSYSPRQKVEALKIFGLPKRPKWLVVEFYAGNDASEIIEDEACAKLKRDYRCRFDFTLIASGLSNDEKYQSLGAFGDFDRLMGRVREVRSDSLTLAVGTGVARKFRRLVNERTGHQKMVRLDGEAITFPGFTHFQIYPERHLDWITRGLDLTLQVYDGLLEATRNTGARVVILYNPTSYEIYREVLRARDTDATSDAISRYQRESLRDYARGRELGFCDLTVEFRRLVANGSRGIFGDYDGTHWSHTGRRLAAKIIYTCLAELVRK